jgi:hypothetical protein
MRRYHESAPEVTHLADLLLKSYRNFTISFMTCPSDFPIIHTSSPSGLNRGACYYQWRKKGEPDLRPSTVVSEQSFCHTVSIKHECATRAV